MSWYRWDGADLVLKLHVQPGAKNTRLAGRHGEALKIAVAAPPLDGRANRQLAQLLARLFGVAACAVRLERGERGRSKTVRVLGAAADPALLARMEQRD